MKIKNILVGLVIGIVISVAGSMYASMIVTVHPVGYVPTGEVLPQEQMAEPTAIKIMPDNSPLTTTEDSSSDRIDALEKRIEILEAKIK